MPRPPSTELAAHHPGDLAHARLAAIVTSSADAISGSTLDGILTDWNPAAERVFGYTAAEAIGQHISILAPQENADAIDALLGMVRRGESIAELEVPGIGKGGRLFDLSLTISPVRDEAGQIIASMAIARDISARKAAEAELAAVHQASQRLLGRITDGFFSLDRKARFTYIDDVAERLLGRPREQLLGINVWEAFPMAIDTPIYHASRKAVAEGVSTSVDFFYAPDNAWYEARVYPGSDGTTVFYRDVTELRRQQEEVARLAAIVESSNDAIVGSTLDGIITSWNPAAANLYGFREDEAVGQPITMLIPPGEPYLIPDILGRAALGEQSERLEVRGQTRDGRILDVGLTISPIRDRDGQIVGASTISRDETRLRRLQVDRDRLYADLKAEIQRAAEIQSLMLPQAAPDVPGYEFAGVCRPARDVGGDFYDWRLSHGAVRLTLGDVMGKGLAASLLTASVRASLRAVDEQPVAEAVEAVNDALYPDLAESNSFITLFHASLEPASGRLTYVDAGHGMSFVLRGDGRAEPLRQRNMPLGVVADAVYPAGSTTLEVGDTLVIYSDGLPDTRPDLSLDPEGVARQVAGLPGVDAMVERLMGLVEEVEAHPDDLTLVLVQRLGVPAAITSGDDRGRHTHNEPHASLT
jgi:sigma-B regulation protein RsbU (phosphoserine phosphatase)